MKTNIEKIQIQEEFEELNDPLTVKIIKEHRNWKSNPISFKNFLKKYKK